MLCCLICCVSILLFEILFFSQFRCGRTWCLKDAFICLHNRYCQAKKHCYRHSNCPQDQYCDTYWKACRKGVRRCTYGNECGNKEICKSGLCQKRECRRHKDCPGNQACDYPPGICKNYSSYCYEGYPGYCRNGYTCVASEYNFTVLSLWDNYETNVLIGSWIWLSTK